MDLYDVPLHPSSSVIQSETGSYSRDMAKGLGPELVLARPGGLLDLYTSSPETGALKLLSSTRLFSNIRSISNFRSQGSKRDQVVVGTDSGSVAVIAFGGKEESYRAKTVQCEIFGKTGVRRPVPGQYVASDPKGRAIMISAIEKQKLVYVMNRDSNNNTTISSPLSAHKSSTITFDCVGVDVGFDNPVFAALELSYENPSSATKNITYYELDLGLNHVTRRWTEEVTRKACCVRSLPGGSDGPSGVIIGGEDVIEYHNEGQSPISVPIPRREHHPSNKPTLVTKLTVHKQKKNKYFALAQTELGDVFKITTTVESDKVVGLRCQLIDTVPVGVSMNVTKMGLMFLAAEVGDHTLYQLEQSIISLDGAVETTNATKLNEVPSFTPENLMKNMRIVDTISNVGATTGLMVGEFTNNESSPQIYALCGSGPRSTARVLRHGAAINQLAVTDLPGTPSRLFTVKGNEGEDKYIVVSFVGSTLVLSVGESVEEVSDSQFALDAETIGCGRLSDGGYVQVTPSFIRHIKSDGKTYKDWQPPGLMKISHACCNETQVVIVYDGQAGKVIYFELDESMNLNEKAEKSLGSEVTCLDVGVVPKGRNRSLWCVVGTFENDVKVLSLSPHDLLTARSTSNIPEKNGRPSSLCIVDMIGDKGSVETTLSIGTDSGVMQQTTIDGQSGGMGGNPTRRFLGAGKAEIGRVAVDGKSCCIMLSSRPWLSYLSAQTGGLVTSPLSYTSLDHACGFTSDIISEGIIATSGNQLHILTIENIESNFNETKVPLRYTPRQTCLINGSLAIVEADARDYSEAAKVKMGYGSVMSVAKKAGDGMEIDSDEDEEGGSEKATVVRGPVPENTSWGSCIRLIDPSKCTTLDVLELEDYAALSCCAIQFSSRGGEVLLAVGIVKELSFDKGAQAKEYGISLYRVVNSRLTLLHTTKVNAPVLSMTQFNSKLLVGCGGLVRLYDMGKKQLLRKCEARATTSNVKTLAAAGDRIYVGTLGESIKIMKFDATRQQLNLVCQDAVPRNITAMCVLDINTVAAGDRFGNVVVLRSPDNSVEETMGGSFWSKAKVPLFEMLCHYHTGEIVTGLKRASLISQGQEAIIYTSITGKIGALMPLKTKDDVEFFTGLQDKIRNVAPRPVLRDFAKFRGLYAPVKKVVDGDVIGLWGSLKSEAREKIAGEMERTVGEVGKKIESVTAHLM
ncbi:hypothetical protein TrVE_jg11947 [Triparma verrucosa]|uniref:DNA damage-binding protein 1 n=1 Tax=Triparma verrucosa TaxID=1606542 RepID=A0A9W7F2J9_9STRA|nr:hypothetical protein TrVE_jg11947 [Triparma verrucosa]